MNKKGNAIGIILFFVFLFLVLIIGFIGVMVVGVVDFAGDTVTPVMEDLGMIDSTNVSEAAEFTFGAVNTTVQAFGWLLGLLYVSALIFSIIFAISYSSNPNPVFIGFYFVLIILLIFGSIIMSNMYEDIYRGTDEIATRVQEQTLMSYMILYSPFILSMIALLTGIYLFAKPGEGGGFGV